MSADVAGGQGRAAPATNDHTVRECIWHRYGGDDWASFDRLPLAIRRRLAEHAYDAWSVNALILWRRFRRTRASAQQAERALLRYLGECEALERAAFAAAHLRRHGTALPHVAARATVLRHAGRVANHEPRAPHAPSSTPQP